MTSGLDDLRQRLGGEHGRRFWRGLEELVETEAFQEHLRREFPDQADQWTDPLTRRQFLILAGASLALAGAGGCSTRPAPAEKIMPYVRQPEGMTLGRPLTFATAFPLAGYALGLVVASREGRPIKVEGNPSHPISQGASDVFSQASILGLYDPDRSQAVTFRGRPRARSEALSALRQALADQRANRGAGLRVLSGTVTSPTLAAQLDRLLKDYPAARWVQYEPAGPDGPLAGARLAFGEDVCPLYALKEANVILSLDADFLGCGPAHLLYVRDFAARRKVRTAKSPPAQATMNRLYAVEGMPTNTGAVADHRLPVKPSEVEAVARALAAELKVPGAPSAPEVPERWRGWVAAVAADLQKKENRGASAVLAGDYQPAAVHALAHAINHALGNVGKTVRYLPSAAVRPTEGPAQLTDLTREMQQGGVSMFLVLGANPVYTAPADLDLARHLRRVKHRFHLGLYQDETAVLCDWHLPEAHYLEAWGDARAIDGTATIMQPLIAPLYGGWSAAEVLQVLTAHAERPGYEIVRATWQAHWKKAGASGDFEAWWARAVQAGVVPETQFAAKTVALRSDWAKQVSPAGAGTAQMLEISFRPDPALFDGRFANNGWLQELPRPVTRLTWDSAAFLSPKTAARLGIGPPEPGWRGGEHGEAHVDVVEMSYAGRKLQAPAWIVPGHADDCVTVYLGHGRERAGQVGSGSGFDACRLRTSDAPWTGQGLEVRKTGGRATLACVQMHHGMEGREPVRAGTLKQYQEKPDFAKPVEHDEADADRRLHPLSLYPEPPRLGRQWGMAIDLSACVGCGACVVACQAENNIPVVGKAEVTRGREMHWLRIDRYYVGNLDNPGETYFQPVPCMHCEKAPCELVCPVAATVHSHDGLNDMVYNRCVGTRYCSNNCPYKVRRFNFLQYADYATAGLKLLHNPQVTVRSRGVMEKCTYCVQRIRNAEIQAEREDRPVRDGELMTACQQACPAGAIVFGDINDLQSEVMRLKKEPTEYGLLADLNTRPRTTYLAALRNPNPDVLEVR